MWQHTYTCVFTLSNTYMDVEMYVHVSTHANTARAGDDDKHSNYVRKCTSTY